MAQWFIAIHLLHAKDPERVWRAMTVANLNSVIAVAEADLKYLTKMTERATIAATLRKNARILDRKYDGKVTNVWLAGKRTKDMIKRFGAFAESGTKLSKAFISAINTAES
jgi:hypothetical protein